AKEGRYALADRAFAAAMKSPPDHVTLAGFRASRALARYHTAGALEAYRHVGPAEETFDQLAPLLLDDSDLTALEALLDAHSRAAARSESVARYRWRLKARQGQAEEASRLFRAALEREKNDAKRKQLTSEMLRDMAEAGKALEAYRAAPDGKE